MYTGSCPDSKRMRNLMKLGGGQVDKVVDICVMAIAMKATLHDMENLDFAYAPPFSTAIHPLVTAVNILLTKISGQLDSITPAEYQAGAAEGYQVIDVSKTPAIEGAPFFGVKSIRDGLPGFDKGAKLLLVCTKGRQAYLAQNKLRAAGYTHTKVLEGGTMFNGNQFPQA